MPAQTRSRKEIAPAHAHLEVTKVKITPELERMLADAAAELLPPEYRPFLLLPQILFYVPLFLRSSTAQLILFCLGPAIAFYFDLCLYNTLYFALFLLARFALMLAESVVEAKSVANNQSVGLAWCYWTLSVLNAASPLCFGWLTYSVFEAIRLTDAAQAVHPNAAAAN